MGAIPTKESQEISARLERIEAALKIQGQGGSQLPSPRPDAILAPSPPAGGRKARGAQFVSDAADDGPVHGSPAGARFHVREKTSSGGESPAGSGSAADSHFKHSPRAAALDAAEGGNTNHPKFALPAGEDGNGTETTSTVDSPPGKPVVAPPATTSSAKADRQKYFSDMPSTEDWREVVKCPGVKCSWLSCMTVALSFVADNKITMESMLRENELALHYVSMPSVTTAEVYDMLAEYVRGNRDLRDKIAVDVANFDAEILDEDEVIGDENGTGDRPPTQSLIQFRKNIAAELADDSFSVHILNFDPYLIQEAESKAKEDDEELAELEAAEEEAASASANRDLAASMTEEAKKQQQKQWQPKNMGAFAILTGYNAALHAVTLAIPHLAPDGTYTLEAHQCPLQTLYNACCVKDGYTKRTRGVVRVFRVKEGSLLKPVKPKYPTSLIDGRQSRGMLSIALDIAIAPHILGLGLLHEVVRATILATGADTAAAPTTCVGEGGIELRGIPVTDICRTLALPVGTIVGTATRASLPTATVWYRRYLESSGIADKVDVGCVSVTRRDDSDDGAVNIDEDDFFEFLSEAVASPTTAVLLAFNVNVAKNVRVVPDGQSPSHFAMLLGFDKERNLVQLADVSVKKYRKVWHTTPELLYRSVIGHGFITAADKGNALAEKFDGLSIAAGFMSLARYGVSSAAAAMAQSAKAAPVAFEHPPKNYSMTVLAKGLNTVIGSPKVRVEDLTYASGFHLSFMLSEHLPILATQRAATYFCFYHLENAIHVETTNFDAGPGNREAATTAFEAAVKEAVAGTSGTTTAVLVNYNGAALNRYPDIWNGSFGGNLAQVIAFDGKTLLLEDSNPEPFYRRWACPLETMIDMMAENDPIADRARGFMVCKKGANPLLEASRLVDMRRAQSHHPFKNPVSSIASAIALALSEVIPGSAVASEEVVYADVEAFNLTTLTSQVTPAAALAMVEGWLAQNPNNKKKVKVVLDNGIYEDEHKFLTSIAQVPDRVSLLLYDASIIFPGGKEKGLAAGVVTRALASRPPVVVCDGSPTRHGDMWARSAADVHKATKAVLHFTAVAN